MDYYNKNITYKGLTDHGQTVTLLDENKQKWKIWKKDRKNPQMDTEAFASLQAYKMGDTFGIKYGEKPATWTKPTGEVVNYTERTIYLIMPVIDSNLISTPQPSQTQKTLPQSSPSKPQRESNEAYSRRLAIYGLCNGWLAGGSTPNYIRENLYEIFMLQGEIDKALYEPPIAPDIQEMANEMQGIPQTPPTEDITVEDIPF